MDKKYKRSLRLKVLSTLILLPTIGMLIYSFMAVRLFSGDKKAYIFDSGVTVANALAAQVKMEISFFEKISAPIFKHISPANFKLGATGGQLFAAQDSIEHLFVFQPMGNGIFEQADYIYTQNRSIRSYVPGGEILEVLLKIAQDTGFAIQDIKEHKRFFLIAQKVGPATSKTSPIALAVYEAPYLYESFASPTGYHSYLVTTKNMISITPRYLRDKKVKTNVSDINFFKPIFFNKFPMGITEIDNAKGDPKFVSFSKVGVGELFVASVIDKNDALSALDQFIFESAIFLCGLLALIIMIGIISSFGLTSALSRLVEATQKIAKGDFDVKPNINSQDEIQHLADSIEHMSAEVKRLMEETAERARMSNELATVKATQEMLFPPSEARIGSVDIATFCEPASECGGDWVYYRKVDENTVTIWIGDATGHGAPAALVTSAAKAASSIIELFTELTPGRALSLMNHAIHSTTKGSILMTFFLGKLDLITGKLIYSCASHEFPLIIPAKDGLTKKDFIPLCDATGPRLGEQETVEYKDVEYQLNPGDSILMYTDGVTELENPEKVQLGERNFYKILGKSFKKAHSAKKSLEIVRKEVVGHQNGAVLADDVTLFVCKFAPAESQQEQQQASGT